MPGGIAIVPPPSGGAYRVARRTVEAFAPPSWAFVQPESGTFGNRFDDPSQIDGVPEQGRYRVISCATSKTGAFGEVLAHLRPSLDVISQMSNKTRDPGRRTIEALEQIVDPQNAAVRLIAADWRRRRQIGHAILDPSLRFANVADPASLSHLREIPELARIALDLELTDIDLSAISSQARPFTQACSRYIHEVFDDDEPMFAGIRYLSRMGAGPAWECWSLFDDRVRFVEPPTTHPIDAEDSELLDVASLYHLTIEADDGRLIRPWQD